MYTTLISAQQLQTLMKSGQPVMVFDCSFELMTPGAGDEQYKQAHIAGAVRADLDRHLSANGASDAASGGRHPLPSRESFAAWLSSIGFTNNKQAVVYDRQGATYCGRLWWMLKWAGHDAVAVLDGGLQAWQANGGATQCSPHPSPRSEGEGIANFNLRSARAVLITTATITKQLGRPTQTIVDARGAARFKGEVEPLDPVAGHIPGALNRPFNLNLDSQGKFKPADQLKAEFEALLAGRDPATVVHHCGSGVSAVPNIIAMEVAGLGRSALYAGSWSEWCSNPARPCAQG
jgi:thiosulfate/3-mercaptopyruvate sulfurtransferase